MINKNHQDPSGSELGKKSAYDTSYAPEKLFPISRAGKREEIGIDPNYPPFYGFDCWNHYEVSWLNPKGKPVVAMAEIIYDCHSPNIIESKSHKLYFNSFNNSQFESFEEVQQLIKSDLEKAVGADVTVNVYPLSEASQAHLLNHFEAESLDDLDVECSNYLVEPGYLSLSDEWVEERLCSDLLKSNCLVTFQPDWGSVYIHYKGKKINREGLLKYIVSFRNHNEFHEQCIERIFIDILNHCQPEFLTVYGRYTRRGGLDINPYRSTHPVTSQDKNQRLIRQ